MDQTCHSTARMIAGPDTSATEGRVVWAPARSLWLGAMTAVAVVLGPSCATPGAVALCAGMGLLTAGVGSSLGLHRLLIHRSFAARPWLERVLVTLGTLAGAGGPLATVRSHDLRDWSQRQGACHPLSAHAAPPWRDYWWQLHCRLELARPPRFRPEVALTESRFLCVLEAGWMPLQLPLAALFYAAGGLPWLVWGIAVRIAACQTVFWAIAHATHRRGPQGWRIEGAAVQGHDLPIAAWLTFGEAWHANHHAWPGSARLGLALGQDDPGWWLLLAGQRLGLVWDLKQPRDLRPRDGLRRVA